MNPGALTGRNPGPLPRPWSLCRRGLLPRKAHGAPVERRPLAVDHAGPSSRVAPGRYATSMPPGTAPGGPLRWAMSTCSEGFLEPPTDAPGEQAWSPFPGPPFQGPEGPFEPLKSPLSARRTGHPSFARRTPLSASNRRRRRPLQAVFCAEVSRTPQAPFSSAPGPWNGSPLSVESPWVKPSKSTHSRWTNRGCSKVPEGYPASALERGGQLAGSRRLPHARFGFITSTLTHSNTHHPNALRPSGRRLSTIWARP